MHIPTFTDLLDHMSDTNGGSRPRGYGSLGSMELGTSELSVLIALRYQLILVTANLVSFRVAPNALGESFPLGRDFA